jgi:hypothetical protein
LNLRGLQAHACDAAIQSDGNWSSSISSSMLFRTIMSESSRTTRCSVQYGWGLLREMRKYAYVIFNQFKSPERERSAIKKRRRQKVEWKKDVPQFRPCVVESRVSVREFVNSFSWSKLVHLACGNLSLAQKLAHLVGKLSCDHDHERVFRSHRS